MQQIKKKKAKIELICATLSLCVGMILIISGFWVPPIGDISPSVLVALGELLSFCGSVFGIKYHYQYKYEEGRGFRDKEDF